MGIHDLLNSIEESVRNMEVSEVEKISSIEKNLLEAGKLEGQLASVQTLTRAAATTVTTVVATHKIDQELTKVVINSNVPKSMRAGFTFNLSTTFSNNIVFFGTAPVLQSFLGVSTYVSLVGASAIQGVATGSISALKQMITMHPTADTAREVIYQTPIKDLVAACKKASFWCGVRNGTFASAYFGLMQHIESVNVEVEELCQLPADAKWTRLALEVGISGFGGGAAGLSSMYLSHPVDIIMRHSVKDPHAGWLAAIKTAQEQGFYKGAGKCTKRMMLSSAALAVGIRLGDAAYQAIVQRVQESNETSTVKSLEKGFYSIDMGHGAIAQPKLPIAARRAWSFFSETTQPDKSDFSRDAQTLDEAVEESVKRHVNAPF